MYSEPLRPHRSLRWCHPGLFGYGTSKLRYKSHPGAPSFIMMIIVPLIPAEYFGYFYLSLTISGLAGAVIVMLRRIGEIKGLYLTKVTGLEWDKKRGN